MDKEVLSGRGQACLLPAGRKFLPLKEFKTLDMGLLFC